jgi:hypothetical protein
MQCPVPLHWTAGLKEIGQEKNSAVTESDFFISFLVDLLVNLTEFDESQPIYKIR